MAGRQDTRSDRMLKLLDTVLSKTPAVRDWQASRDRVVELGVERSEIEGRIDALTSAAPEGLTIETSGTQRYVVTDHGRRRIALEAWRAERDREAAAVAVLEGRELPERAEDVAERLIALIDRRDVLTHAIRLAEDKVRELHAAAQRAVLRGLGTQYRETVLGPAKVALDELGQSAEANWRLRKALVDAGFSDATIPGIALEPYRTDQEHSRASLLLRAIEEFPAT